MEQAVLKSVGLEPRYGRIGVAALTGQHVVPLKDLVEQNAVHQPTEADPYQDPRETRTSDRLLDAPRSGFSRNACAHRGNVSRSLWKQTLGEQQRPSAADACARTRKDPSSSATVASDAAHTPECESVLTEASASRPAPDSRVRL